MNLSLVKQNHDPDFASDFYEYFDGVERKYKGAIDTFMMCHNDYDTFIKLYETVDYYEYRQYEYIKKAYDLAVEKKRKRDELKEKSKDKRR